MGIRLAGARAVLLPKVFIDTDVVDSGDVLTEAKDARLPNEFRKELGNVDNATIFFISHSHGVAKIAQFVDAPICRFYGAVIMCLPPRGHTV
jgi:hypothetical protein